MEKLPPRDSSQHLSLREMIGVGLFVLSHVQYAPSLLTSWWKEKKDNLGNKAHHWKNKVAPDPAHQVMKLVVGVENGHLSEADALQAMSKITVDKIPQPQLLELFLEVMPKKHLSWTKHAPSAQYANSMMNRLSDQMDLPHLVRALEKSIYHNNSSQCQRIMAEPRFNEVLKLDNNIAVILRSCLLFDKKNLMELFLSDERVQQSLHNPEVVTEVFTYVKNNDKIGTASVLFNYDIDCSGIREKINSKKALGRPINMPVEFQAAIFAYEDKKKNLKLGFKPR